MKATDLMIGDWVVYNGDVEYTDPIRIEGMDIATDMLITSDREDVGFDGVEPIPLTTEILEKNGFKFGLYGECFFCTLSTSTIKLFKFRGDIWWFHGIKIEKVHELQHLLRLCGIKKEIVL